MAESDALAHLDKAEGEVRGFITPSDVRSAMWDVYADINDQLYIVKDTGGSMSGQLGVLEPVDGGNPVTVTYADANLVKLSGDTVTGAVTVPPPTADGHAATKSYALTHRPYKNLLVNGGMRISQRWHHASYDMTGSTQVEIADRWTAVNSSSGTMRAYHTNGLGPVRPETTRHAIMAATVAADATIGSGEYCSFVQTVESPSMRGSMWGTANARPLTLSFWVMSSRNGTFSGAIRAADSSMSYAFEYNISTLDNWEYKTITIPGPTTGTWPTADGVGFLDLWLNIATGSSFTTTPGSWTTGNYIGTTNPGNLIYSVNGRYIAFSSAQLEFGSVASKFEHVHVQQDLNRCMRHLQRYDTWPLRGMVAGTGFVFRASHTLPVTMAKAPTVTMTTSRYVTTALVSGMATSIPNNFSQPNACQIEANVDTSLTGKVAVFANVEGNSPVWLTA